MTTGNGSAAGRAWQRAMAAFRAGDAAGAEQICRRALQNTGHDPALLVLLGATLVDQQRAPEAEAPLRRAVEVAPGAAPGHEGLGEALLRQGKFADAARSLETARRLEPGRLSVLVKLGGVFVRLGQFDDAVRLYRELVERSPGSVDALLLLADAEFRRGGLAEATASYERAAALAPQRAGTWAELGHVQQLRDELDAAERSYRESIRLAPDVAATHASLGTVLTAAGRQDDAMAAFERALALDGRNAVARTGLAHALSTSGQTARAIEEYRKCMKLHPGDGAAWWGLASLRTFRFEAAEVDAMRQLLADTRLDPEARTNLEFALATALDASGVYDEAFRHFELGNGSRRRWVRYDSRVTEAIDRELVQVFDADFLRRHAGSGDPDPAPIFIVGMPRSGSTLIEQILASHSLVDGTHELPELNRMVRAMGTGDTRGRYPGVLRGADAGTFRALGAEYLERTRPFRGAAPRFTDKMSNNFRHVGLISLMLPNARIIDARRHPLDSCMSCYKMLFSRGQNFTYDLRELGEYYVQYRRLMDHWRAVLPGFVLDVDYERLVADFEPQVRRILDFCGLPWEPRVLSFHENPRHVRTASSEQVRRPLYSSGVHRWRDYEPHLDALVDVLEPVLRDLPEDARPRRLLRV